MKALVLALVGMRTICVSVLLDSDRTNALKVETALPLPSTLPKFLVLVVRK
jgi:hypothetical protein